VNPGFRDIDMDATNDWTFTRTDTEVAFATTNNPLHWNTLYNFWFDSDAAPAAASSVLDAFAPGTGAPNFTVATTGPGGLPNVSYGIGTPGCNGAHHICGNGAPTVGNAGFALSCSNAPVSALGLCLVANAQDVAGSDPFQLGILLHLDLVLATDIQAIDFHSDAAGLGTAPAPIPNNPVLIGVHYFGQGIWAWTPQQCQPSPFGLSSSDGLDIPIQ
jgi:hypothetical protein